jgi:hypothetical protein
MKPDLDERDWWMLKLFGAWAGVAAVSIAGAMYLFGWFSWRF